MTSTQQGPGLSAAIGGSDLIVQGNRDALLRLGQIALPCALDTNPLVESRLTPVSVLQFVPGDASVFVAGHHTGVVRVIAARDLAKLRQHLAWTVRPSSSDEIDEIGWHTHLRFDTQSVLPAQLPKDWSPLAGLVLSGPRQ